MFYVPNKKKSKFEQEYSSNFVNLFNKAVQKSYLFELKKSIKTTQEKQRKSANARQVAHSISPKRLIYDRRKLVNNALKDTESKKVDQSNNNFAKKNKTESSVHQMSQKKNLFIKVQHKNQQRQISNEPRSNKRPNIFPPLSVENRQVTTKSHILQTLKYWNDLQSRYFSKQKLSSPFHVGKNPISERAQNSGQFYLSQIRRNRNLQISLNQIRRDQNSQQNQKINNKNAKKLIKSSAQKEKPEDAVKKANKTNIDEYFQPWEIQTKYQQQAKYFI